MIIKEILSKKWLLHVLLASSALTNIIMVVTTQQLPNKIREQIDASQLTQQLMMQKKTSKPDSIKIVTATLPQKGILVFFEGKIISEGIKLRNDFEWTADDDLPSEIWNGYIHLVESKNHCRYYLWADWKIPKTGAEIKGWFVTFTPKVFDTIQGKGEKYVQLIVPVVQGHEMRDGL